LSELKLEFPDYAEVHSQVLQDVLLRLERALHAFFRRVKHGQTPGYPRFQGVHRYHSFTYPQYGNGAVLDGGILSLSKLGRIAIRLHRPLVGSPKTVTISHEADGWYACVSRAEVPVQPLPPTGCETGSDVGLRVFLITAEGGWMRPRANGWREVCVKRGVAAGAHRGGGKEAWAVVAPPPGGGVHLPARITDRR
jgi:putative transposase